MTSHLGCKSIILSLEHHFCEVNDEGRRSTRSHRRENTFLSPSRYFLDGLFLSADLMEGEPLCQCSAAEREGYVLEASAPQNKPSFHSSRCFIIGASLVRGKKKKGEAQDLLRSTISSDLELRTNQEEMLEFNMSTRS